MKNEEIIANISTWLILAILMLSALVIPTNALFSINSTTRLASTSVLLLLFGILSLKRKSLYTIDLIDIIWILLISHTALSPVWAMNAHYSEYGLATTITLYLAYKAFKSINWSGKKQLSYLRWGLMISLLAALSLEMYCVFVDYTALQKYDKNLHLLGSLITLLLPFILFDNKQYSKIINPIILLVANITIYYSGSAMVFVALFLLSILYILSFLKRPGLKKMMLGTGILFCICTAIIILNYKAINDLNGGHIIKEFYTQNDRLQMWDNSISLFKESPFVGIGKNNWELKNSMFGYDFERNRQFYLKPYRFTHAHNSFFQILSETGLIGIVLYITMILALLFKINFSKFQEFTSLQKAGITSAVLFILLSLMYGTVYNHYNNFKGLTIILMLALSVTYKNINVSSEIADSNRTKEIILKIVFFTLSFYPTVFSFNLIRAKHYAIEATVLKNNKENNYAIKAMTKAYNLAPSIKNLDKLTNLYKRKKLWNKAAMLYKIHLESDHHNAYVLHQYGNCLFELKQYNKAFNIIRKCNVLDSSYLPNKLLMAQCQFMRKNIDTSIKQFKEVRKIITDKKQNYSHYKKEDGTFESKAIKNKNRILEQLEKRMNIFINERNIILNK